MTDRDRLRILANQGDPIAIGQLCPIRTCVR